MVKVSLALVLFVTACSDGADTDAFVGTWRFDAGAQRASSCDAALDLSGTLLFVQPGNTSDLMILGDCQIDLAVSGDTATEAKPSACMKNGTSGAGCRTHIVRITVPSTTLALDGSTMTLDQVWTQIDEDTCGTRACNGTVTGTLTKTN